MSPPLDRPAGDAGLPRVFATARSRRRFLLHVAVALAALVGLAVLGRRHLSLLTDAGALRALIRGYGVWGPIVLVVLQALQVLLAPVPGQFLAIVGGYLFGPWWGTLYNMLGIAIGSTLAFWLSRRFGRSYVESVVHEETLARFDAIDDAHALLTLFVFFLVPGLPDDVLCFVGGLTRIPLRRLVAIAVLGRSPGFFLVNVIGDSLGTGRVRIAVALGGVLVAATALGYLHRDRLLGRFGGDP